MHNINFQKISLEQGLSQSVVYCILQDNKDFMWFGTQEGINRYDGYKFTVYKNEKLNANSIADNYIFSSFNNKSGQLWFGSLNGHLIKYDSSHDIFTNLKLIPDVKALSSEILVTSICEDTFGNLWIGTDGAGLIKYNTNNNTLDRYKNSYENEDSISSDSITSLYCDEEDLWIGTWDSGINVFNLNSNKFIKFKNDPSDVFSISSNKINFIFKDSRKILWIGTKKGLNKFDPDKNFFYAYYNNPENENSISENNLTSICEDDNGILWIGSRNNGLNSLNVEENKFNKFRFDKNNSGSLGNDAVISLYKDSSNVIWIGTYGGGINILDRESKKFFILDLSKKFNNPNANNINCILEDRDSTLWVGTHGEGLFEIDRKKKEIKSYKSGHNKKPGPAGKSLMAVSEDKNSDIWIGTHIGGLNRYRKDNDEFENYLYDPDVDENNVWSIYYNKDYFEDIIFIGTLGRGLLKFNLRNKKFSDCLEEPYKKIFSNTIVKTITIDSSKNIWFGTNNIGLFRINPNKKIKQFVFDENDSFCIGDNTIISIYEDKNKTLWIGTYSGGLNKFDKRKEIFKKYTMQQGLPNNMVKGILEDKEGYLWLSTNSGLSKFNPQDETFRNFYGSDGLQSNEFNDAYCKDKDGTMYFCGINGISYFRPEEIKINSFIPKIIITDFQIFNHSVKNSSTNSFLKKNITETKEIILSYRESVFSFEFAAMIYNNSQKNQYAYMMEGFDKEWIYCGSRRFATYTSLEPGEYLFRVKGSNNDEVWNEEGTSIKIIITPPFWKTWWFKSLGVMSIVGATGLAYKQKLSQVEKEKKLQEEFSRKLMDSQEAERKKIAFELHHTIAHDILITKNKAVIGLRKPEDSNIVKNILNEISDLASNTLNDVRSISYNLHPHQIERLGMTKAVRSIINNVSKSTDIKFSETIDNIDKILSKELEINLFRIIQESISNIIRHSKATEGSLNIIKDNKTLLITIWDNGQGIPKNTKYGLGLTGITERIKLYKGELVIESDPSKGTLILISLPILKLE